MDKYEVIHRIDPDTRFIDLDFYEKESGSKVLSYRIDLPTVSLEPECERTEAMRNITLCAWGLKEFLVETATEIIEVSTEVFSWIRDDILNRMVGREDFYYDEAELTKSFVSKIGKH